MVAWLAPTDQPARSCWCRAVTSICAGRRGPSGPPAPLLSAEQAPALPDQPAVCGPGSLCARTDGTHHAATSEVCHAWKLTHRLAPHRPAAGHHYRSRPAQRRPAARWRHRAWYRAISPLVFLVAWQLVSASGLVSQQKLPSPTTVFHTAVTLITGQSAAFGTL